VGKPLRSLAVVIDDHSHVSSYLLGCPHWLKARLAGRSDRLSAITWLARTSTGGYRFFLNFYQAPVHVDAGCLTGRHERLVVVVLIIAGQPVLDASLAVLCAVADSF